MSMKINSNNSMKFGQPSAIDRYQSAFEPPSRPLPSVQRIKVAISALENNPKSVTLDTLECIMMLRYLPQYLPALTGRIIPPCISILEQSTKRGEILGHEAGVLALQIICFSIAASVLVQTNHQYGWFGQFLETLRTEREKGYLPPSDCDVSILMVSFLSTTMAGIINKGNQELSRGLAALHGMFSWTETKSGIVCQENLGGFTHHHARFLLEHLWSHRKSTLKTFRDTFLPGWSLVIHILWKHIVFSGGPESVIMMKQLRELVIRFSLVCTSAEDFVIYRHYLEVHSCVDHPTLVGPVDREDLELEVSCCVSKLVPPEDWVGAHQSIPLDFATDLMEALFYDIHESNALELYLPLIKAGFARLWVDLSKVPTDSTVKWVDVVPFTYQLLALTSVSLQLANEPAFQRFVVSYPIIPVLVEAGIFDVIGRLCLMPLLLKEIPPGVEKGDTVSLENNQWTDLSEVAKFVETVSRLPRDFIQPPFVSYEQDWLKTYIFMRQFGGRLLPRHPLRRWANVSDSTWVKLGKAYGFKLPKEQCFYARCSGANGVSWTCMGCSSAVYCSEICQARDWFSEPNPHKLSCSQPPFSVK